MAKPVKKKPVELISHDENQDDENQDDENQDDENQDDMYSENELEFTEKIMKEYQSQIKFNIFDPQTYKVETHQEIIIVNPQNRLTSEIMTKPEYTEIVSIRAQQIEKGAPIFANIGNESSPIKMAEMEVYQKKCPLNIRRMYNDSIGEIWSVNEMGVPN